MVPDKNNLFALIHFDEAMLSPILRRRIGEVETGSKQLAAAELVAAYFWLSLGTDLGYFPWDYSVRLAKHRFTELLNNWSDFLGTRGDLFSPEFRFILETLKSRLGTVLPPITKFEESNVSRVFFREALVMEVELLKDQSLATSMAALTFLRRRDLEAILYKHHHPEQQFSVITGSKLLESQFPAIIRHIHGFSMLDQSIGESSLQAYDQEQLRARIRALTRWRLNFRSETVKEFFPVIADNFFSANKQSLNVEYEEFRSWVNAATSAWGFTHRVAVGSGA